MSVIGQWSRHYVDVRRCTLPYVDVGQNVEEKLNQVQFLRRWHCGTARCRVVGLYVNDVVKMNVFNFGVDNRTVAIQWYSVCTLPNISQHSIVTRLRQWRFSLYCICKIQGDPQKIGTKCTP